ncbi:hypothetical protein H312_00528 [Anncaliia algerae PRA339]|uniref:Uncharacterized protein n=1 Tax=Anncaliia algerae PRA339 TaxID=1288291 RepID=A0A059F542_9MICR|nr:hypothetical protein H312_00528 [Anncaliia algerae PRA339]
MHFEEQLNELLNMNIIQMFNKLVQDGFIQDTMICQACIVVMCLKPTGNKIDAIEWRCMNYRCPKYQTTYSIRKGSWLEISRFQPRLFIKLFYIGPMA